MRFLGMVLLGLHLFIFQFSAFAAREGFRPPAFQSEWQFPNGSRLTFRSGGNNHALRPQNGIYFNRITRGKNTSEFRISNAIPCAHPVSNPKRDFVIVQVADNETLEPYFLRIDQTSKMEEIRVNNTKGTMSFLSWEDGYALLFAGDSFLKIVSFSNGKELWWDLPLQKLKKSASAAFPIARDFESGEWYQQQLRAFLASALDLESLTKYGVLSLPRQDMYGDLVNNVFLNRSDARNLIAHRSRTESSEEETPLDLNLPSRKSQSQAPHQTQHTSQNNEVDENDEESTPFERVSRRHPNLTELARKKQNFSAAGSEFDPMLENIRRSLLKSQRRTVVILGPSGSGKGELVNRFIKKISDGAYPEFASDMPVFEVTAASLGSKYVSETENRVGDLISAARAQKLLFVMDEFHSLRGLGTHSRSSQDVFEGMKGALSRGELPIIGISTPVEFYAAFNDPALLRRFNIITLEEPRGQDLNRILKSWARNYVPQFPELSDDVISEVIRLSSRYNAIGSQPDKSIGLLEDLIAGIRLEIIEARRATKQKHSLRSPTVADVRIAAQRVYRRPESDFNLESARERLANLRNYLNSQIVGNDLAKEAAEALSVRAAMGVQERNSPAFVIYLGGNKGAGKTSLATHLATARGVPLKRIPMQIFAPSAFRDPNDLRVMIKNFLAENADTQFLLDEVDKADRHTLNVLLDIFETGVFTVTERQQSNPDMRRVTNVDVRRASFVLTGNWGKSFRGHTRRPLGFANTETQKEHVPPQPTTSESFDGYDDTDFRDVLTAEGFPEFLLDRVNVALWLAPGQVTSRAEIVRLQLLQAQEQISKNLGIHLSITNEDEYCNAMAARQSDRTSARYLERLVDRIEILISRARLSGLIDEATQSIALTYKDGSLQIADICRKSLEYRSK